MIPVQQCNNEEPHAAHEWDDAAVEGDTYGMAYCEGVK